MLRAAIPPNSQGFWSLYSDVESIAREEIRIWAIAETILANVGFWYVAVNWESNWLLFSSCFVAPLLLLRSDASVKQGMVWYLFGFFPHNSSGRSQGAREEAKKNLKIRANNISAGVGLIFATALAYPAANYFLTAIEFWDEFRRGAIFALVITIIAGVVANVASAVLSGPQRTIAVISFGAVAASMLAIGVAKFVGGLAAEIGAESVSIVLLFLLCIATTIKNNSIIFKISNVISHFFYYLYS